MGGDGGAVASAVGRVRAARDPRDLPALDRHSRDRDHRVVFGLHAKAIGISREQFQAMIEQTSHRRRSTTLAELADVAALMASDRAGAMTGTVAGLTGGIIVD